MSLPFLSQETLFYNPDSFPLKLRNMAKLCVCVGGGGGGGAVVPIDCTL